MYHLDVFRSLNYDVGYMRKAAVAEWILSRSRESDRASAITGDLMEQAESRGGIWFWFSLIRTVVRGPVSYGLGLWLLCRAVQRVVTPIVFWRLVNTPNRQWMPSIFLSIQGLQVICQFLIGRAVATRAPRRELSAWMTLSLLEACISLGLFLGLARPLLGVAYMVRYRFLLLSLTWSVMSSVLADLFPALLGAMYARRRFRQTVSPAQ
jgi:hypothetical protein